MTFSDISVKCYRYPFIGRTLIFVFRDTKGNVQTCIVLIQKNISNILCKGNLLITKYITIYITITHTI